MTRLFLAILLATVVTPAYAQRDGRAEHLVTKWIEASGGARMWDRVRDVRYTITTVWYDTAGVEVRRRPRYVWVDKRLTGYRVRVERTEAEGRYVQIWNGNASASLNGRPLPDSARAVREVEYVAADLTYWIGLPWKLRDPGVNLAYLEENGAAVVHVTFGSGVGLHDGDRFWYYWHDRASPFPTEVHYIEEGRSERERVTFGDRQRIGPAVMFGRRTRKSALGVPVRALIVTDVVINRGMASSLFELTSDVK